jgi:hypothetical protein
MMAIFLPSSSPKAFLMENASSNACGMFIDTVTGIDYNCRNMTARKCGAPLALWRDHNIHFSWTRYCSLYPGGSLLLKRRIRWK